MSSSLQDQAAYHHLLLNFQQTKTHLSLTNLNPPHLTSNPEILKIFLQRITKKLQTTKNLKKLTLSLQGAQLNPNNLKEIYQYLIKELRDIENLEIILNPDLTFLNQSFELLLKILRAFRGIKIFKVALPKDFETASLKYKIIDLVKALRKLSPRLKEAKFTFIDEKDGSVHEQGLPILQEWGMNQLGNLQKLTLDLPKSVFIDQGQLDLSPLKRVKRLKSLEISLFELHGNQNRALSKELSFDPSEVLPNLKHFKWSVVSELSNQITGIELFGSEIAYRLGSLEDFGLKFQQGDQLKNQDIKETIHCLTSLKTDLNQLSLTFNNNKLNSSNFIEVLAGSRFQKMHTLSLEFIGCKGINGAFIDELAQTICKNMKGLKSLRLYYEFSQTRTKSLITGPFAASEGLADQEINKLGIILSEGCENLELIYLEFWRYSHISDKGVMSLCNSLSQIKSLKTARFQFKFCPKVSSVSVRHAKEKFGPQRNVKFTTI